MPWHLLVVAHAVADHQSSKHQAAMTGRMAAVIEAMLHPW
jgi:hypothetical protein